MMSLPCSTRKSDANVFDRQRSHSGEAWLRYLLIPPTLVWESALNVTEDTRASIAKSAPPPRWIQGWGPRDIDTLVVKVLLDHILWYGCESYLDVGANTQPYATFSGMIGLRATRCDVKGYTRDCVLGALPRLPFKDKSYDMVSCLQVLEHLPDSQACIDDLCRVTRKVVIIQVPNGDKDTGRDDPTHINFFTLQRLKAFQMDGWTQHIMASNVIATRLPNGVSMAHDILCSVFSKFYANNFFVVYVAKGLKPAVRQPGLLANI